MSSVRSEPRSLESAGNEENVGFETFIRCSLVVFVATLLGNLVQTDLCLLDHASSVGDTRRLTSIIVRLTRMAAHSFDGSMNFTP